MTEYIYDGTFEGFLCCIYAHYYIDKASNIAVRGENQQNFLGNTVEIETEEEKATLVYRSIEEKISTFDLQRAYRIFLCGEEGKEMVLLNYLRLGFIKGGSVSNYHGFPLVREAEFLEKKVTQEVVRLKGLLRFSVLEGEILYSEVEPDNDVVELLAPHFSDRYKNDPFIIHDLRRKKAVIAAGGKWYISQFSRSELPEFHTEEIEYRRLWKKYFESIAIKERTNPRCQKNFMPVRYWKHLTEIKKA